MSWQTKRWLAHAIDLPPNSTHLAELMNTRTLQSVSQQSFVVACASLPRPDAGFDAMLQAVCNTVRQRAHIGEAYWRHFDSALR